MVKQSAPQSENFCDFANDSWFAFFDKYFGEIADVFESTGTDWDIVEFSKTPTTTLVLVQHGLSYTSGLRLLRYSNNGNSGPAGIIYALGCRYVGGGQKTAKIIAERAEFILALRRQLSPISPRPQPLPHDQYVDY